MRLRVCVHVPNRRDTTAEMLDAGIILICDLSFLINFSSSSFLPSSSSCAMLFAGLVTTPPKMRSTPRLQLMMILLLTLLLLSMGEKEAVSSQLGVVL